MNKKVSSPSDWFFSNEKMLLALLLFGTALIAMPGIRADMQIAPWYPQGSDFVFICGADFNATSYDWNFDNGQTLSGIENRNVYHHFVDEGIYDVACTAKNGNQSKTYGLTVQAGTTVHKNQSVTLEILHHYPQELAFVFVCEANGFNATSYDWYFGDGEKLLDVNNSDVYHKFAANGKYNVRCAAKNNEMIGSDELEVIAGGIVPPSDELKTAVRIAPYFPKANDYVFVCDVNGFTATHYDWHFGDGEQLLGMSTNDVFHTYKLASGFDVKCEATDDFGHQATGTLTVQVSEGGQPQKDTCSDLMRLPANCQNGVITQDELIDGCRHVKCEKQSIILHAKACGKPEVADNLYEVYRLTPTCGLLKLCIGEACVGENGFAAGLLCDDLEPAPVPMNVSVELEVALFYPKGREYVFKCNALGFTASNYDWDFGDGQHMTDVTNSEVFHEFENGAYNVSCTAKDGSVSETDKLTVIVDEQLPPPDDNGSDDGNNSQVNLVVDLKIADGYPVNSTYQFICSVVGATPETYDWFFGDDTNLTGMIFNDVTHTFYTAGNYTPLCVAKNSTQVIGADFIEVSIPVNTTYPVG